MRTSNDVTLDYSMYQFLLACFHYYIQFSLFHDNYLNMMDCSREPNREIPRQLSSNRLMNNIGYDKSVDTMLSEAAQMRADLATKRAAKKAAGEESKNKKKY